VFFVIHVFRMALFFLIAGFFAHLLFHRRGLKSFVRDRTNRILWPMLLGWALLAPLTLAPILLAAWIHPVTIVPENPPQPGFPLLHLWFLYYLIVFYGLVLLAREAIVRTIDRNGALRALADRAMRGLISTDLAPLIFAVPTAICLYFTPDWVWTGVPTPDMGLIPQMPALIAFGTPFVVGWLLHRQTQLLAIFERRWIAHLVVALGATAAAWYIVGAPMGFLARVPADAKVAYAIFYALAMWAWVFALIGIGLRFFSAANPKVRYLADASYWMYLMHLPLVFALQLAMMRWSLHWSLKFPLMMAMTFGLLLLGYRYLVRDRWLGQVLDGRRSPLPFKARREGQSA
jgi:glucan biosynthesis protein C